MSSTTSVEVQESYPLSVEFLMHVPIVNVEPIILFFSVRSSRVTMNLLAHKGEHAEVKECK